MALRSLRAALAGLGVAAAVLASAGPAAADPPPVVVHPPGATYCHFDPPVGGQFICKYGASAYVFPDGRWQVFVIGTDYAVWTRWETGGGGLSAWTSMGGLVSSGVTVHANGWAPYLTVLGTNLRTYYNARNGTTGQWSGWYL